MDPTTADHLLLQSLIAGDHQAFNLLAARYQALVRCACRRQADQADGDDCVQAVFLVLLHKPRQALRAPALSPWLLVVTRHVCATARRAARSRRRAEQAAASRQALEAAPAGNEPTLEHLDECLARLPPRQRAVITLHYLSGMPRADVAAVMEIDIDTVHQYCHRALERLRILLQRRGVSTSLTGLIATLGIQTALGGAPPAWTAATLSSAAAAAQYAAGAMTAVTVAPMVPVALGMAGLLALAAVAALAIHVPRSTPQITPATTPIPIAADVIPMPDRPRAVPADIARRLERETHVEFDHQDLRRITEALTRICGVSVAIDDQIDRRALPTITLLVDRIRIGNILYWIEVMTGTHGEFRDGTLWLRPGAPIDEAASAAEVASRGALLDRLQQPISFAFQQTSLLDAVGFLRQVTGVNIVVFPEVVDVPCTLTVDQTPVHRALDRLCVVAGIRYEIAHQAIMLMPGLHPAPPHADSPNAGAPPHQPETPQAANERHVGSF